MSKSRKGGGISGKWTKSTSLCCHSMQNFGLFKEARGSHGDRWEPRQCKLTFSIHLNRFNLKINYCEPPVNERAASARLICSLVEAARSFLSESGEWASHKRGPQETEEADCIPSDHGGSNRMHSSIWAALLFARFSVATESLAWCLWPRYLTA